MTLELLQDAAEFWPRAAEDIRGARARVYVQALSFEGDTAGQAVAAALAASPAPDRRVLVDCFTKHVVSDRLVYQPRNFLDPALRGELRATRRMLRDLMLRVERKDAARFLGEDFLRTWEGRAAAASGRFPGLELHALDGHGNEARFEEVVLSLLDRACDEVHVECAYPTSPFLERLGAAARRGVKVTVVTPEANNWGLFRDLLRWPRATRGIDVRLYRGRMTHMKALLVDRATLVLGSANFDLWSYHFQGEYLTRVTDPGVVEDFKTRVAAGACGAPGPWRRPRARCAAASRGSLSARWKR